MQEIKQITELTVRVKKAVLQPGQVALIYDAKEKVIQTAPDKLPKGEAGKNITAMVPESHTLFVGTLAEIQAKVAAEGIKTIAEVKAEKDKVAAEAAGVES